MPFFQKGLENCKLAKSKKHHQQHVEKRVSVIFFLFFFFQSLLNKVKKFLQILDFLQNSIFLESVSFQCDTFGGTNFAMVLCVCIVHVVIVIKKNIKLFKD